MLMAWPLVAGAKTDLCPMLVEGKTWVYAHHQIDESGNETNAYLVEYTLMGDTVIDGRAYKKMYRWDEVTPGRTYFGAFREDEDGRVWQYEHRLGDKRDHLICDVTLSGYPGEGNVPIGDTISIRGKLLHRYYREESAVQDRRTLIGVETVGLKDYGIVKSPYDAVYDFCDYETFEYVSGKGLFFSNADFTAPKYIELTDEEEQLVEKNNDFAFRLLRRARTNESLILSPLSITYALGMLNNGADGQTRQEISQVLGFDDVEAQNRFCQKMTNELKKAGNMDSSTKALISNTIFVNKGQGWQLQKDFTQAVGNYYYVQPQERDFADGKTCGVINQWAKDHTEGVIREVISEQAFKPNAVSYLLNAIYFKGMWSNPFETDMTKEERFANGSNVPMMHKRESMMYEENDLYQTVRMPYGNGTYNLQVLLPREGRTLDKLAQSLDGKNWKMNSGNYSDMDLKLPRFETSTDQNLVEVMKDLGMPSAFSPAAADFPHFCTSDGNPNSNICIDQMKQVAKIKLDEKGTEAAAVTIIETLPTGLPVYTAFHANRPFLYIISEQSTGIILFIGQYMGEDTSAVAAPLSERAVGDDGIFSLSGQRLSTPPSRGLYIRGGRVRVAE